MDDRELQNCRCPNVCVPCQHFRHGVDQHCHTLVASTSGSNYSEGPASDQDLQALGVHLAKHRLLGSRDGVNHFVSKDGSALELLSGHPVLKDEEAVFAEAMERQRIGIYPHISLALINCQEFKVPVLAPDLRVASGLTKFTRKDFSEGSISILGELALSLDDFSLR